MHGRRRLAIRLAPDNGRKRIVENAARMVDWRARGLGHHQEFLVFEYDGKIRRHIGLGIVFHMVDDLVVLACHRIYTGNHAVHGHETAA